MKFNQLLIRKIIKIRAKTIFDMMKKIILLALKIPLSHSKSIKFGQGRLRIYIH